MKAIVCDVRRALTGRWFWAALLATTAALYLSIGQAADALMDDTQNLRQNRADEMHLRIPAADGGENQRIRQKYRHGLRFCAQNGNAD